MTIEKLPIEKIIRQKRKTIAIEITEQATIVIKAPLNVSKQEIEKLIVRHRSWIEKRLRQRRQALQWKQTRKFQDGDQFLYLGKLYPLKIVDNQHSALKLENNQFLLNKKYQSQAQEVFIKWYKRQASENFNARARIFAPLLGVEYSQIKLSSARTRWGSCSNRGNINIVWRLIMAPQNVIDYVIVHELAHLRYMNHSHAFWHLVAQILPQYQQAKDWLKKYGHFLNI